ncbi:DUF1302 domain-containing protein [Pseudomonas sp. ICMP22404]|uniref:DUF1302 domain-containing protein n=1 Tax=Pseudomonas sp. ICMP22404 TaxID=2583807 RepID=UPI001118DC9F|nr:DUF1302 domain-containing protein [Pseudomonas sp. ICMP22404]TNF83358.1 DUF1302 domain-containing protein [Pseudomonas sp. ICMP22404]
MHKNRKQCDAPQSVQAASGTECQAQPLKQPLAIAVCVAMLAPAAQAGVTQFDNGLQAIWALDTSLTMGWRARSPNQDLVGPIAGGNNSTDTGSTNVLNFDKGDNFTTLLRVIGEVNLKKEDQGVFIRAKAWDNIRLDRGDTNLGAPNNGYDSNKPLDDSDFDTNLSKFKGVELLDLYTYSGFNIGDSVSGEVKLGQHAVNWGESLYVPGINSYSVLDVNALRQPGTLLKEAILPIPQVSFSFQLPNEYQLEAFYQFEWKRTSIDGCGTYWSPSGALNCSADGLHVPALPVSLADQWLGNVPNSVLSKRSDEKPDNLGQYGVALKKYVDSLDTEFGLYHVNYHTHTPSLSVRRDNGTVPGSIYNGLGSAFWDYSAEDIKITGISASTVLGGWAVAGELSFHKDVPVSVSGTDLFLLAATGVGPMADRNQPLASDGIIRGYDRKDMTQLNLSTIKSFGNVLGASSVSLTGEFAYQHWAGIGNPKTDVRYGRAFEYGVGAHSSLGGDANCGFAGSVNAVAKNCSTDGYATTEAYGVRAQVEAEYPSLIANVTVRPRLFLSRDLKGWSADGTFIEDRTVASVGARFDYMRRYYVDLSYTDYNTNAYFDNLNDRDFFGLVIGASF